MKRITIALFTIFILSFGAKAQTAEQIDKAKETAERMINGEKPNEEESRLLPLKSELNEYLKKELGGLLTEEEDIKKQEEIMQGSSCSSSLERKKLFSVGWFDPKTGAVGYITYCVHSFLGITWGDAYVCEDVQVLP